MERGFVTIEYVLAVALSMLALVVIANFIVFQYGRGVVRAAVDQGVRSGARAPAAVAACEQAARQVVADLLGGKSGSMGRTVSITCIQVGGRLDATADGRFRAWLPPVPDWSFHFGASAVVERSP
jgi:type IV secretory pathway TrbL component